MNAMPGEVLMGAIDHPADQGVAAESSQDDDPRSGASGRPRPPWDRPEQRAALPELYDALTLLPNEVLLIDRLSMALTRTHRTGEPIAIVRCAISGFDDVHEAAGPEAVEKVLTTVAKRLQRAVRTCDTVARADGQEFILLLERLVNARDIHVVLGRVKETMAAPIVVDRREHSLVITMGAVITNDPMLEIDELFDEASRLLEVRHDAAGAEANAMAGASTVSEVTPADDLDDEATSFSDWTLRIFGDAAAALDRNKHP